jgi:hypothetical protein
MGLGKALGKLGERESGTARIEEAITAFRAALEEQTRDRVPLLWAYANHALAANLATLAERRKDRHTMAEALGHMREALDGYRQVGENYWAPIAARGLKEIEKQLAEMTAAQ